jgi:phage terminase large subunit
MSNKKEQESINVDIRLTPKQSEAFSYLTDNETNVIVFGSGAGSGKSLLGCIWIISQCLRYPKTRHLIGRAVLTQLRLTTQRTLMEAFQMCGMKSGEHYTFNQQTNIVSIFNGSEIILKDLADSPSDPMKDALGSLEITSCMVDEAAQISRMTYNILKSRIRFKLNEYNLPPKMFLTLNPSQNWLKSEFHDPWLKDELPNNIKFIKATAMDNPHLPPSYIETLRNLPKQQMERLLMGNWDYLEDEDLVFDYESITSSIFRNDINQNDQKYMSCDIARLGKDSTVVCIWVGLCLIDVKIFKKLDTSQVSNEIKELIRIHGIHPGNIVIDTDGVGAGVADQIRGKNFMNNARALYDQNFVNLKTQSYVKLSDLFKSGEISINVLDPDLIDTLTQELLTIKYKKLDQDTKVQITSKDERRRY